MPRMPVATPGFAESLELSARFLRLLRDRAYPLARDEGGMAEFSVRPSMTELSFDLPGLPGPHWSQGKALFGHDGTFAVRLPGGEKGFPAQAQMVWSADGWDTERSMNVEPPEPGSPMRGHPAGWGSEDWDSLGHAILEHAMRSRDVVLRARGERTGGIRAARMVRDLVAALASDGAEVTWDGAETVVVPSPGTSASVLWNPAADGCDVRLSSPEGERSLFVRHGDSFDLAVAALREASSPALPSPR